MCGVELNSNADNIFIYRYIHGCIYVYIYVHICVQGITNYVNNEKYESIE